MKKIKEGMPIFNVMSAGNGGSCIQMTALSKSEADRHIDELNDLFDNEKDFWIEEDFYVEGMYIKT